MPKHARSQPGHERYPAMSKIRVFDDRPELGNPMKLVATFDNVSPYWTGKRILEHFGIAEHFHVIRSGDRLDEIIQEGRR